MAGLLSVKKLCLTPLILQNPFTQVVIPERMSWTSSSLKLFRKCKRKFFWKYMMRLVPRNADKHLTVGSAFHHVLGEWYKGSRSSIGPIVSRYIEPLIAAVEVSNSYYDDEELDKFRVMVNTFTGMLHGYERQYGADKLKWSINRKSIEAKFKVDMGDFDFMGKIDLLANHRGKSDNFLVEHKTASSIRDSFIDRLPLDTQIRGYVFGGMRDPKLNFKIDSVLYDVVKKCKLRRKSKESIDEFNDRVATAYTEYPQDYFYREQIAFSKSDLDAFEYEVRQTHNEYQAIVKEITTFIIDENTHYENPTNPRAWTPNDATCDEYFRLCEYHGLCVKGLDKGTGLSYNQIEEMHQELQDEA